jgi:hypothetical protein
LRLLAEEMQKRVLLLEERITTEKSQNCIALDAAISPVVEQIVPKEVVDLIV